MAKTFHGGIAMKIYWVVALGGIGAAAVSLLRRVRLETGIGIGSYSAMDILRKRYARGDITGERYEEIRQNLKMK
jgi:uncharacterized membrane protein